jgi:ATPase family associated with various cellular activities (AAA).
MTIKEAKQVLKEMIIMYLQKDDRGNYIIPYNRQRPAALIGPAGIGKTEAAKQVAEELNIGFLSYTITHQTRQSAVGLPVIKEAEFCGNRYQITEYTMSDIIAAVYKRIEGGKRKGFCFLTNSIVSVKPWLRPFWNFYRTRPSEITSCPGDGLS